MNKLLSIALAFLLCTGLKAQVTIGSSNSPKEYSILQIDGTTGGLRLPKLTKEEREEITPKLITEKSRGLVIYYIPDNTIQFWDGENWVSMRSVKEMSESNNGISGDEVFKLGNNLLRNTDIAQGEKHLYFDASKGRFSIGDNMFVATNEGVGIGKTASNAVLDVYSETPEGLRMKTEGAPGLLPGNVLVSDEDGIGTWQSMKPNPKFTKVALTAASINSMDPQPLAEVNLTPGMWLIMGRYVAKSTSTISSSYYGYHAWIHFRKKGEEPTAELGALPQWRSSYLLATPQITYILKVDEDNQGVYQLTGNLYSGRSGSSLDLIKVQNTNLNATDTEEGNSYLYAIQLSY